MKFEVEEIRERMVKFFMYNPQSYRCYGKLLKISPDTFRDFLEGKNKPHPTTLARVVKFLDENEQKDSE